MRSFIEEYGLSILSAIVAATLIAMCTPVGTATRQAIASSIETLKGEETQTCVIFLYAGEGNFEDGTNVDEIIVDKDSKIINSLPTPTSEYYDFAGWYTQPNGGDKVTKNTTVQINTKYFAHWQSSYTILPDNNYKENGLVDGRLYKNNVDVGEFKAGTTFNWHNYNWTVLKTEDQKALIITTYILDSSFNKETFANGSIWNSNTTATSIRGHYVYNNYFTSYIDHQLEQVFYKESDFLSSDNSIINTAITSELYDEGDNYLSTNVDMRHVFLLSEKEINDYLDYVSSRVSTDLTGATREYWNRSIGNTVDTASLVFDDGTFRYADVTDKAGVRPALYVDLTQIRNLVIED